MRVLVDRARCEGHGMCEKTAHDVFVLDDEGYSHPRFEQVPEDLREAARAGAAACPMAAIAVIEGGEQL